MKNKKNMDTKSFFDLYKEEREKPTAAQLFIANIAKITHRSEQTVRIWLTGTQTPDDLAQSVIAKAYGVKQETLFPKRKETAL